MTAQTPVPATPEISLVEAVWRFRLMSFLIVLASVLVSVAATQLMFSSVQATARFAVTDPTNNNNVLRMGVVSGQGYATYTAQRAAFAGSAPVLARAAEIVKSKRGPKMTGEQLRGRVKTSSKPDGGVVIVNATGESMPEAALIANAVVQAYQDVTVSTNIARLDNQLKALQNAQKKITDDLVGAQAGTNSYRLMAANLKKLQVEESGLLSARAKTNDGVQFVDTADTGAASGGKLPRNMVIGLAIGLIVACVVSFLRAASKPAGGRPAPAAPAMPAAPAAPAPMLGGPAAETPAIAAPPRRGRSGRLAPMDPVAERVAERAGQVYPPEEVEAPRRNGVAKGKGPRVNGGHVTAAHAKPAPDKDAPVKPAGSSGDPTRTAEDVTAKIAEEVGGDPAKGSGKAAGKDKDLGKGKGESSLMRYDLDR
ncbi:hypothetical protein ACFVH6_39005 [Spirillospora sp. NPDC127200]